MRGGGAHRSSGVRFRIWSRERLSPWVPGMAAPGKGLNKQVICYQPVAEHWPDIPKPRLNELMPRTAGTERTSASCRPSRPA